MHRNELRRFSQTAPFLHGLETHSSISVSHLKPVYPVGHWQQVRPACLELHHGSLALYRTQLPPFKQESIWQAATSQLLGRKSLVPQAHTKPLGDVGASKQGKRPHGLDRQMRVVLSLVHGSNLQEPSLHLHTNLQEGWVVSMHSPVPQEFSGHMTS